MNGSVLLDTNIVIALFANDQAVIQKLARTDEVFVSSIVLGELYFGAHNSSRAEENTARLDAFVQNSSVLRCDNLTAKFYGQIKRQLKLSGTPIPENDIWIAAVALQFELVLATRDRHFGLVEGLDLEHW